MGDTKGPARLPARSPHRATNLVTFNSNDDAFDLNPITIDGFRLRARSVVAVGKPSIEGWANALRFASASHEASPYWIGDLVAYAENRDDWREKLDQAKSVTGLAEQTLHNLGYISRRLEEPERQLAPSPAHAAQVASLERPEQTEFLTKARTEGWTVSQLKSEIRASRRKRIIDGQAELRGMYRVILADPPWLYSDSGATADGSLWKAARHYQGMTIEELCKLPVKTHAMANAVLFLWVTAPMLYENPGPREVIEAWGFTPKTGRVWNKVLGMHGHYASHIIHEHLIIATRGSGLPDVTVPEDKSIFVERRTGEHSEKPALVRTWIELHWTRGPYLELFGRKSVEGWTILGNDARLWSEEVANAASVGRL